MSNCGEYNFNMFIILPAYINTLCNITTWSESVAESGVSEFSVGRVVLCHDVSLQGFGPGTICLYYFAHISHVPKT